MSTLRRSVPAPVLVLASALALGSTALAQQITVDLALDDFTDFGGGQTVADLPGPDGHVTLREAVTAANRTPGPQTIVFAIPQSQWWNLLPGRPTIRLENFLYVEDDETVLDFSTQTAFTGDTNPDGMEVALYYAGPPAGIPCLWLAADRCTVRGLDRALGNNFGNGIWITGNENRVVGCTTTGLTIRGDYGGGAFNVVGGTGPGEGNTFHESVEIRSRANDNLVVGNTFTWGLAVSGDTFWGLCERNRIGGPSAAERNVLAGKGYYGEEGFPVGTQLQVFHALDTVIEGNYVGTTSDGLAKEPGWSGTGGIHVGIGAVSTLVRDNVVAGILMIGSNHYQGQRFGVGISVGASSRATTLAGNRVGVGADGETPIPNVYGIVVQKDPNGTPDGVLVGGSADAGNVVAFNEQSGVRVGYGTPGVRVTGNSIHDNGGLGIDLDEAAGAGVTANDPLDADDQGGNHLQNFPVLTRAVRAGSSLLVSGTLESEPLTAFAVDLYASATADPSGHGEGARFLGSVAVATDAQGRAPILASLAARIPPGWVVSATATHLGRGETSEFSAVRRVTRTQRL